MNMRFLKGIHLAVAILLLTIGVGLYADLRSESMHGRHLQIQLGLERMVRLNQSLTNSITLAVVEKNSLRAASYDTLQTELDATMQEVQALTQGMTLASEILSLRDQQHDLRAFEKQAFEHMRTQQWEAAYQALLGGDYVMSLKLYEINSESAVGALNIELANSAHQQNQLRQATLVLRLLAAVLLLWAGWRYSRRLQTELAEQVRLQSKITQAKNVLEATVQQRTRELQVANQQLETLSITDALTGLTNRRRFDTHWAEEWQRALRQSTSLAVIMLDVDHFKDYNDHYGHPQGDACLQRVGEALRSCVRRAGELAARYGGEEFVVVLPGATPQQAQETANSILNAMRAAHIPHACSPTADIVTVSMGVAAGSLHAAGHHEQLVKAADWALYQAKHQGRNRVVQVDINAADAVDFQDVPGSMA
jgi:diguanylate cyclase (GGDEF)-like protein